MSRRKQNHALLNEYCDQLALLVERRRTERALIIAKHQAENAATRAKVAMKTAQATDRAKTLFVRMETGDLELDDQEVALGEVLDAAMRPLRKSAVDKSITIIRRTKVDCRLRIDPEKMAQAFTNILSNAIKFTPEDGRIEIDAEFTATGALLVMVRDNGRGIPPDKVDRVLQPFGQAETQLMRHGALGLGLPIARALIRMHGGKLTLTSEVDKGTTAAVALPPERVLRPAAC
jgi:two-component system cell cycle sensor histidine kinase PleC